MTPKRILVTGASGCVGHYITDTLIQQTPHELFLLVRDPQKLRIDCEARPGIHVLKGNMHDIERFSQLLKTIDVAVLTAAVWGGTSEVFDVNVVKTIRLMNLLDPDVCEQVIYFSTASILDQDHKPLKQACEIGTDYIRSKYDCHKRLANLAIAPQITTVFPTLVFGGNETKPYSHLSAGLPDLPKWINLARFFKLEGSFHFMHGQDIAQVIAYLIEHPPEADQPRELILGGRPVTANQAIEAVCAYLGKRIYLRLPLSKPLINVFITLFGVEMAAWDRFCLNYRYFTYRDAVSPETYSLPMLCPTIADLLSERGIVPQRAGRVH